MRTESHHVVVTVTKKHLEIVNWKYRKLVFCFGTAEVKYRAALENESEAYVEHEDITCRRFCYSMIWRQWLCISSFNFCFKLGQGLSPWKIYIAYINAVEVECSNIDRQKAKFQMAHTKLNEVWSPSANVQWVGSNVCKKISTSRKPILFVSLSLPFIPFIYSIHQNSVTPVKAHCMQAVEWGSHIKGRNTKENRCCVLKSEANEMQAGCFCRQVLAKKCHSVKNCTILNARTLN